MALRGVSLTYRHCHLRRFSATTKPLVLGMQQHGAAAERRAAAAAAAALPSAAAGAAPLVADLGPMLQKVKELNNGFDLLADLVPFTVDGAVLGRMLPE
jgi:hypothetical protein